MRTIIDKRKRRLKSSGLIVILMSFGPPAFAQDADDDVEVLRENLRNNKDFESARSFQALGIFGATPGISNAIYEVDAEDSIDTADRSKNTIRTLKIPIAVELTSAAMCPESLTAADAAEDIALSDGIESNSEDSEEESRDERERLAQCLRPYVELSLGYLSASQEIAEPTDDDEGFTVLNSNAQALSALAGAGLSVPLGHGLTLRPILLAGYSHLDDDTDFDGEDAELFDAISRGIILNVTADSLLFGGAAELRHHHEFANDIGTTARLRYNYLVSHTFHASDRSLEETNDFSVLTASFETRLPTGLSLLDRALYLVGSTGGVYYPDYEQDSVGNLSTDTADLLFEIGGGFEIADVAGLEGVRLRALQIFGPEVDGWKVGLSLRF